MMEPMKIREEDLEDLREGALEDAEDLQEDSHPDTIPERVPIAEFQSTTRLTSPDTRLYVYRYQGPGKMSLVSTHPLLPPLKVSQFRKMGEGVYMVDLRHPDTGKPVPPNRIWVQVEGDRVSQIPGPPEPEIPEPSPSPSSPPFSLLPDAVVMPASLFERFLSVLEKPQAPSAPVSGPDFLQNIQALLQIQNQAFQATIQALMESNRMLREELLSLSDLRQPEERPSFSFLSMLPRDKLIAMLQVLGISKEDAQSLVDSGQLEDFLLQFFSKED